MPGLPADSRLFQSVTRRIIGEWGFQGLKIDGQDLNGVAPCYNPAHNHARPEELVEKLQDFWKAIYDTAMSIDPNTNIEICPCGDSFAFFNIPGMNNTPASDPESSWQVRLKGKTFKAMMGPSAPFSGDHVELSDGGDDFASTYGIGGIPSTKFTWPKDTDKPTDKLPPGGFVLTPQKEQLWRKWIALYRKNMLSKGQYLGELYDIGFDKPEAHVVTAGGKLHYAFYAKSWSGPIALRGLGAGRYRLTNSFTGEPLGTATRGRQQHQRAIRRFPRRRSSASGSDCMNATPAPSGRAWLVNALITVVLWGVWGAFSDQSAKHGFPGHAGLLRLGADDDPAGVHCAAHGRRQARDCRARPSPMEWRSACSARAGRWCCSMRSRAGRPI